MDVKDFDLSAFTEISDLSSKEHLAEVRCGVKYYTSLDQHSIRREFVNKEGKVTVKHAVVISSDCVEMINVIHNEINSYKSFKISDRAAVLRALVEISKAFKGKSLASLYCFLELHFATRH